MQTADVWNRHYKTDRSRQRYPDENLVRLLSSLPASVPRDRALDYGFGSGRHLSLLRDFGFQTVCGTEVSSVALDAARRDFPALDLRLTSEMASLPWDDSSFHAMVCWGVLHYLSPVAMQHLLTEFRRLLAPQGRLFGTLRSDRDTHFAHSDVADSSICLFSEAQARTLLESHFPNVRMGHMERTPLDATQLRISHWFFSAAL